MIQSDLQQETEWWQRFKEGDDTALEKIYRVYFARLYNYGLKFCNESVMVEDAIQGLFLKLMRTRERLTTPNSIQGYLFFSLRTSIFDELEKAGRLRNREILSEEVPFDIGYKDDKLVDKQEEEALQGKLKKAMGMLTPRQREAVYLRYQSELSYPEVASALQLNQKSAYKLIARAIGVLREASLTLFIFLISVYKSLIINCLINTF